MTSLRHIILGATLVALPSLAHPSPITSSSHAPWVVKSFLSKRIDLDTSGDLVEPQVSMVEQGFEYAIEISSYVV